MRDLLSRVESRHLDIIENLTYSKDLWSLGDFVELYNYSERSFQYDVQSINGKLKFLYINIGDFVTIRYNEGFYINNVYRYFLNNSPLFRLLDIAIEGEAKYVDELKDLFQVSTSTVYRMIAKFNKVIGKHFDVYLDSNPTSLKGEIEDIRALSFHYYLEKFPRFQWPFRRIREDLAHDLLKEFLDKAGISLDYSKFYSAKILIAMNLHFTQISRYVDPKKFNDRLLYEPNTYFEDPSFLDYIRDHKGLSSIKGLDPPNLIGQLFYPFTSKAFMSTYEKLSNSKDRRLAYRKDYIEGILDSLIGEWGLSLPNREDLVMSIYNSLVMHQFNDFSEFILYDDICPLINSIDAINHSFASTLKDKIEDLLLALNIDSSYYFSGFLNAYILYKWDGLVGQLFDMEVQKKILVVSNMGPSHNKIYQEHLRRDLPDNPIVDIYDRPILDKDEIINSNYDIIVTNIEFPKLEGKLIVYVDSYINENQFRKISHYIRDYFPHYCKR